MARMNLAVREGTMPKKELILIASRAVALYFITWALYEVTYLPEHLLGLAHYKSLQSALSPRTYLTNYYLSLTVLGLIRMVALFLAAVLFWRCGPRIEALFSRSHGDQAASD
jgi:hypothetical protein